MKTQAFSFFRLAALALLFTSSLAQAQEPGALPFLKPGSTYILTHSTTGLPQYVRIVEPAGGSWYRVEYIHDYRHQQIGFSPFTPDASKPARDEDYKIEAMWLNFASIAGVREYQEPEPK